MWIEKKLSLAENFQDHSGNFRSDSEMNRKFKDEAAKKFNGEAALLFRAYFHIEGDWRPFEDGILWENEGTASPVESYIYYNTFLHIKRYYI